MVNGKKQEKISVDESKFTDDVKKELAHKHIINMGIDVTDNQLQIIFNRIKSLADKGKCITHVEVHAITEDVVGFLCLWVFVLAMRFYSQRPEAGPRR